MMRRYTRGGWRKLQRNPRGTDPSDRIAFDVSIGAVAAGRPKLVQLHRAHRIDNETLQSLERVLDLGELGAISAKA